MSAFIKVDGINGESQDDAHKDWIDVLSWSWGASQSASTHQGGGGTSSQAHVQDFTALKYVDQASPGLMHTCLSGKHIKQVELQLVKSGGDDPLTYTTVILKDVIISSYNTGGAADEDRLTESVTFNFAEIEFEYVTQDAKGGAGKKPKAKWDVKSQKGSIA